jgi:hypothetical protein
MTKEQMNRSDKFIMSLFFGFIILITPFCLLWWSCYLLSLNIQIGIIIGLFIGIILNILYLSKIVSNSFNINYNILGILYFIYSIGMFGFFMGVPVFNILLGIVAGWYIGRRMKINHCDYITFKKIINKVNIFCLINLIIVCIASSIIALNDKYTAANLEGMFNLNFQLTNSMLLGIILIGGTLLILIQFLAIKLISYATYKK